MRKPTASGLGRAMRCGASLHLPVVESTSAAADRGTWRHRFLELVGQVGAAEALAQIPDEHRDACAALPLDELPTHLAAEVAFAYDVATGKAREIGRGVGRQYGDLGPFELAGTADVVGLGDDQVAVIDWKSIGAQDRARDSVQLRFLALAASRVYGRPAASVQIVRLGDLGEVYRSRHSYDELDLDAFAVELREWFARAGRPDARLVEGDHCTYCPSFVHCPAKARLLQLAAGGADPAAPFFAGGGLTRANVGAAYVLAESLRGIAKELDRRIRGALNELGPCPMPDGRELRLVLTEGQERVSGEKALGTLAELYGDGVAEMAVERHATKKSIREALRKAGISPLAPAEREVLARLRAAGGITRTKGSEQLDVVDLAEEVA